MRLAEYYVLVLVTVNEYKLYISYKYIQSQDCAMYQRCIVDLDIRIDLYSTLTKKKTCSRYHHDSNKTTKHDGCQAVY